MCTPLRLKPRTRPLVVSTTSRLVVSTCVPVVVAAAASTGGTGAVTPVTAAPPITPAACFIQARRPTPFRGEVSGRAPVCPLFPVFGVRLLVILMLPARPSALRRNAPPGWGCGAIGLTVKAHETVLDPAAPE